MTVKELIELLEKQPKDMPVVYRCYSEYSLLESDDIKVRSLCLPRNDGWVHDERPDKPTQQYLTFPGN